MSVGRKLLIGAGSLLGFGVIAAAANPQPATTPSPTPAVLSAQSTVTPTPTPTVATPAPTPPPTPTPKPTVAGAQTQTGSGYTNVDGNHVPSPVHADAPPAGATAQCVDGTYSFSQHHSGTCSHHGGVARWL